MEKSTSSNASQALAPRRAIRLTKDLDEQIELLCEKYKITKETFLEAAYLVTQENQEILSDIVAVAKERYSIRKRAWVKRTTKTMQERFG